MQVGYIAFGRRAAQLGLTQDAVRVAVADCNRDRAESTAARDGCAAYQDYRELLDRKDVDAVIVASPDHWHTLHCIHACQAGKDVYCEKPMTLTIREGRQLVQAVRKYERVFQTGSQQRSMKPNRLACALVREGHLGRVQQIIGQNYPSPWNGALPAQPMPSGLDWDAWCGQVEPVPYHIDLYTPRANPGWISFRRFSGGEMTGWGAHGLDQVQWAMGMDESGPVEVWTEGPPFAPPTYTAPESRQRGDRICGSPEVHFRYATGAEMTLQDGGPGGGAVFIGEKGKIRVDRAWFQVEPDELARISARSCGDARGEPKTTCRTGSTASNRASGRWRTWRSVIAPPPSVTWATSPAGSVVDSAGTRSRNNSSATMRPTSYSSARSVRSIGFPKSSECAAGWSTEYWV